MSLRSWPAAALALTLLVAGPARGEEAAAHGVTVVVPPGYRWLKDPPKKPPSTIIYLQEEGGGTHPAVILVNHVVASAGMDEESVFSGYQEYADAPEDAKVVELPAGRFMRVDFTVPMRDGRTVRQRVYATLRGKHQYSFFLANLEAEAFARHLPAFDALVGGARFGEVAPVAARPEAPKPEPPKPAE
ncbi:MAG: hypothetical protein M9894_39815, partial [Planctomycetes bacterium]|nr:hypothetical protein [Planctomycetota bacterium]